MAFFGVAFSPFAEKELDFFRREDERLRVAEFDFFDFSLFSMEIFMSTKKILLTLVLVLRDLLNEYAPKTKQTRSMELDAIAAELEKDGE